MTGTAGPAEKDKKLFSLHAPPVYFMHIPKTAGTSLGRALSILYPPRRVLNLRHTTKLHEISLSRLQRFSCYLCHFGPGLFKLVNRPELPIITMLRHPVEQTISGLYFDREALRKTPHLISPEYRQIWSDLLDADLGGLLDNKRLRDEFSDNQCRVLGNALDLRDYLADGKIGARGEPLLIPLSTRMVRQKRSIEEIAARAHRQIEQMAVVGLAERFQESLVLIADFLGVTLSGRRPRSNIGPFKNGIDVSGYRKSTPPHLLEQVEAMTRHDRELYAHASDLFARQWAAFLARPRRTYFCLYPKLRKHILEPSRRHWRRAKRRWPGFEKSPALNAMRRFKNQW